MTKSRTYVLTAIAVVLYLFLSWAFADGLFTGNWWDSDNVASSAVVTYILVALIVVAGVIQAGRIPESGVAIDRAPASTAPGQVEDPSAWRLLLGNTYLALFWLPIRFFVGRDWLSAGEEKLRSDAWMHGGVALRGFWSSAVATPEPPAHAAITYGWFRDFLQYMLDHEWYVWFAKVIAIGEFLVGLGIVFGALVGIAAFFGTVMNFNFQLAGSASSNPVLFGLGVFLVLAWKVAGFWGLDRWLLPALGTPWRPGRLIAPHTATTPAGEQPAPE